MKVAILQDKTSPAQMGVLFWGTECDFTNCIFQKVLFTVACNRGDRNSVKQMLPFLSLALWLLNTLQKEMQYKQSYSQIRNNAIKISRLVVHNSFYFRHFECPSKNFITELRGHLSHGGKSIYSWLLIDMVLYFICLSFLVSFICIKF